MRGDDFLTDLREFAWFWQKQAAADVAERTNATEASRCLSEAADVELQARMTKSGFDRAILTIQSTVVLAVEVLGSLAVLLVRLTAWRSSGLELSLFGVEGNVV